MSQPVSHSLSRPVSIDRPGAAKPLPRNDRGMIALTTKTTAERLTDLEAFAYRAATFLQSLGYDPADLPAEPPRQPASTAGLSESAMTIMEIS